MQVPIAQSFHLPKSLCLGWSRQLLWLSPVSRQLLRSLARSPQLRQEGVPVTLEAKRRHFTPFLLLLGHEAGGGAVSGLGRARPLRPSRGLSRQRGGRGVTDPRPWPPRRARRRSSPAAPAPLPKRESPGERAGGCGRMAAPEPGGSAVPGLRCPRVSLRRPGRPVPVPHLCEAALATPGTGRTRVRARKHWAGKQLVLRKFACSVGASIKLLSKVERGLVVVRVLVGCSNFIAHQFHLQKGKTIPSVWKVCFML